MTKTLNKVVAYRVATKLVASGWLYLHHACFIESGESLDSPKVEPLESYSHGEVCAWCVDDNGDALRLDGTRNY